MVRILPDSSSRWIKTVQAIDSRQPQYSRAVLTNVGDERDRVRCERLSRSVEFVDELITSYPESAIAIFKEGANVHSAETVGFSWIVNK